MRRIALHEYLNQIEGLMDDNRLPEAAAHCHFVLQQYPRHIGAYLLFGRALLEQQLYEEAIDIFERLLSADPENLVSHAGLALAYSESRDLGRAIWHMERAFEVDPYNRAVQDELRKLYIARDGDAPPRMALTRTALARLHFRAALYQPAAAEFARLANAYPRRVDIRLALAETLYRDSRVSQAAGLCQHVLETLPFCIKANAIVADAWLRDDRVDEAREHLRRVQDVTMLDHAHLDPETTLGKALNNPRISLPESVQVAVLDDTTAIAKGFQESEGWAEQATAFVVDGVTVPDWLHGAGRPDAVGVSGTDDTSDQAEPDEFMEWLEEPEPVELSAISDAPEELGLEVVEAAEIADQEIEFEDDLGQAAPPATDEELLEALAHGTVSTADSGVAAEPEEDLALSAVPSAEEDEMVPDEPETATPVWEDEQLLALDDLRAFIDEDEAPVASEENVPAWLDELTDRNEDVQEELPQWLYEAVGLDAAEESSSQERGLPGESLAQASDQQGSEPGSPELAPESAGEPEDFGDLLDDELGYLDEKGDDTAGQSGLPDWLLEGDDVLEELPPELVQSQRASSVSESENDASMTWLDELSEQLGEDDDSQL